MIKQGFEINMRPKSSAVPFRSFDLFLGGLFCENVRFSGTSSARYAFICSLLYPIFYLRSVRGVAGGKAGDDTGYRLRSSPDPADAGRACDLKSHF